MLNKHLRRFFHLQFIHCFCITHSGSLIPAVIHSLKFCVTNFPLNQTSDISFFISTFSSFLTNEECVPLNCVSISFHIRILFVSLFLSLFFDWISFSLLVPPWILRVTNLGINDTRDSLKSSNAEKHLTQTNIYSFLQSFLSCWLQWSLWWNWKGR